MKPHTAARTNQQGVASIEFAFVFVLVFMLFYGIISYVIPLLLLSSYNEISAEAVRASVLVPTNQSAADYEVQVEQTVQTVINESWLGTRNLSWRSSCAGDKYVTLSANSITVCIAHTNPEQIIPPITLFGWTFPQLPEALIGEAIIQVR